jgi:flagellar motor switch protein FliM
MTIAPYDFCKPGRLASDRESRFAGWLRLATALATRKWAKSLPFQAEWTVHGFDTFRPTDSLARLSETAVAYRLGLAGGQVTTLLAMPRPLVLAVAAGFVGDAGKALPADRELTLVEESLFEFFVNNHLLPPLKETWPGSEPACPELLQAEPNPRWSRLFGADAPLVVCTFLLSGPFGVEEWHWLLPREGLLVLLDRPDQATPEAEAEAAAVKPRLEARVNDLPIAITVCLGSVEVRLSQLSRLRVGDVVVLDQRVSEPLTAAMGEEDKYRGWPGRVGSSQAFKIESLLNR